MIYTSQYVIAAIIALAFALLVSAAGGRNG
jgi:hypothetical protein